jgi:DNA-binding NarL/FixJ family response regulator
MHILIVEDSPQERELLRYLLESRFQQEAKFREANNLATALGYLKTGRFDCVILDLSLPDSAGRETFQKLYAQFPSIPYIIMTHNTDRQLALRLVKEGASDYILKNYTDEEELFSRIMFAIEKSRHSLRVPPKSAETAHRVQQARANLLTAHQSGQHKAVQDTTVEMNQALTDMVQMTFAEIHKMSSQVTIIKEQGSSTKDLAEALNKEILLGHSDRPSMRSQIDRLEFQVQGHHSDIRSLKQKREEEESEDRQTNFQINVHRSNNRVKVLLGLLTLLGALAAAVATYYATIPSQPQPAELSK